MRTSYSLLALSLLALAGVACSHPEAAEVTPNVAVQVTPVARGPIEQWVRTQAVLYPLQQAIITPKISAPVAKFFVQRGAHVRAGQEVAQLDNRDLEAANAQAQAQLDAATANYKATVNGAIPAALQKAQLDVTAAGQAQANDKLIYQSRQQLYAQGALPRRMLDQAKVNLTDAANASALAQQHLQALEQGGHAAALREASAALATAKAQAEAAAAQLSYSVIRSPINGVVTDRPVYPGELATTSSPLMTIMNLDQVVARAHLPASEAALLHAGDRAALTGPAGQAFPARVIIVSPATDIGSTTVQVWVQADNARQKLRPGTTVAVAVLARTLPNALTVPAGALLTDPSGATSVMVVGADHKAHTRDVTVGITSAGKVQILRGLQAGEPVVSQGAYALADGTPVTVSAAPGPRS